MGAVSFGALYFGLPVAGPNDVQRLFTGDVTGDGRREIFLRTRHVIGDVQREILLNARLMGINGELQIEGKVVHVIVKKMHDHSHLLGELQVRQRNFR